MTKVSRLLSVDASVLRGAGGKEGYSAHCTTVLNVILEICHRAVLTREAQQEWNKHQSRIAIKWRASMIARKKLIPVDIRAESLRIAAQINSLTHGTASHRAALIKDVHILAAARQGDHVIVSSDEALKVLCDLYSVEPCEWLLILPKDTESQRLQMVSRLHDLSKSKSKLR